MVLDRFAVLLIGGDKGHDALGISGTASFDVVDLQSEPARLRGPCGRGCAIEIAMLLRCQRIRDVVDLAARVGGVARAHQRFGRRRIRFTAKIGAATMIVFQL